MPVDKTISSYNTFTANTKIESAKVNANFSNHRGHIIPIDGSLTASVDNAYDLGDSTYRWANIYGTNLDVTNLNGSGKLVTGHTTVSANYSITSNEHLLSVNTAATITFPTAGSNLGRHITVKKTDSGTGVVSLARLDSDSFDGTSTVSLSYEGDARTYVATGANNWRSFSNNEFRPAVKVFNSSIHTPSASAVFSQMTGNNFTLDPGTWILFPYHNHTESGGSGGWTDQWVKWYSENGDNTSSAPTELSATSNVTVLNLQEPFDAKFSSMPFRSSHSETVVTLAATVTIYLVPYPNLGTPANGRMTMYGIAVRIGE